MGCPFRAVECFFVVVWMFGDDPPIPRALPWAMIVCPFRAKKGDASGVFVGRHHRPY